jgi:hypothetical protein
MLDQINEPSIKPPFKCIFCEATSVFSAVEHIIPHSLGNDIVILAPGWVCDKCNNIISVFEERVLSNSVLGIERCRLGVITKKGKPSSAKVSKISWFAEPNYPRNAISAEADWKRVFHIWNTKLSDGKIVIPLHDETCADIAKLLLKIGVEILEPAIQSKDKEFAFNLQMAKQHILGIDQQPWPYFVLLSDSAEKHLISVFNVLNDVHDYVLSLGFDVFLHNIDDDAILFFTYGQFKAAISLTTRNTEWTKALLDWNVPHVGCPVDFQNLCYP